MDELESTWSNFSQISFGTFKRTVDNIVKNRYAPIKKICPGKLSSIPSDINSKTHKEIIIRNCLRNKFIDSRIDLKKN